MNEREATALLEGLVEHVEVGAPPTSVIVRQGRRTSVRRRGLVAVGAAASVAVVLGGVAAVTWTGSESSGGPEGPSITSTSPLPEQRWREVAAEDLSGTWSPLEVLGEPVTERVDDPGWSIFFDGGRGVSASAGDGCNRFSMLFDLGEDGRIRTRNGVQTQIGCSRPPSSEPANREVLGRAARVQVGDGRLTFYDDSDAVLGVYERAWREVRFEDLSGRWRPIEALGRAVAVSAAQSFGLRFSDGELNAVSTRCAGGRGDFDLGSQGTFTLSNIVSWASNCPALPQTEPPQVDSLAMVSRAARVQVSNGVLTLHDADGTEIGRYRRAGHPSE